MIYKNFSILVVLVLLAFINCAKTHDTSDEPDIYIEVFYSDLVTEIASWKIENCNGTLILLDETEEDIFVYARKEGYYTRLIKCKNGDSIYFNFTPVDPELTCGVIFANIFETKGVLKNSIVKAISNGTLAQLIYTDSIGRFQTDLEEGTYFLETGYIFKKYDTTLNAWLSIHKIVRKRVIFNESYIDVNLLFL